jgi:hypothetical protein
MILDTIIRPKRYFNVSNTKDVTLFKKFMQTGAWGVEGCPFTLEYPYLTVPDMIKDKLVCKYLKVDRE